MAEFQLPCPPPMICKGNTEENWKAFKDAYTDYAIATELDKKNAVVQAATLKRLMGPNCKKILTGLKLSEAKMADAKEIIKALDDNFIVKHNVLYDRYCFYTAAA